MSYMPSVTFRLSDNDFFALKSEADERNLSLSALIKQRLGMEAGGDALEALERRVSRLEGMAGL